MRHDAFGRHRFQVELQAARQNRYRQFLRIGRRQQKLYVRWWFFQRLEQRIERMRRQHVHFVDQVHLVAAPRRRVLHVIQQLARVFDFGARGSVDFNQIDEAPLVDLATGRAFPTRIRAHATLAIQTARQDTGDGGFTDAARAREQVGVVQTVLIQRIFQRLLHMLLPHQFLEAAWTVLAGENLIAHGRKDRCRRPGMGHEKRADMLPEAFTVGEAMARVIAIGVHPAQQTGMHGTRGWRTLPATPRHTPDRYRCCLPALAGFTTGRCGGTDRASIDTRNSTPGSVTGLPKRPLRGEAHCGGEPRAMQGPKKLA